MSGQFLTCEYLLGRKLTPEEKQTYIINYTMEKNAKEQQEAFRKNVANKKEIFEAIHKKLADERVKDRVDLRLALHNGVKHKYSNVFNNADVRWKYDGEIVDEPFVVADLILVGLLYARNEMAGRWPRAVTASPNSSAGRRCVVSPTGWALLPATLRNLGMPIDLDEQYTWMSLATLVGLS